MLEWGDVPGNPDKRQVYHDGVALPGTQFTVYNVRAVNRRISDQPTFAEPTAREIINCIHARGYFPPFTMEEAADFLIDKCEDEI